MKCYGDAPSADIAEMSFRQTPSMRGSADNVLPGKGSGLNPTMPPEEMR